jgi:hypothetical protein
MGSQRFRAVIAAGPRDSAVILMPFDPDEARGAKADHPGSGTIGGCRIRTRLVPAATGLSLVVPALPLSLDLFLLPLPAQGTAKARERHAVGVARSCRR